MATDVFAEIKRIEHKSRQVSPSFRASVKLQIRKQYLTRGSYKGVEQMSVWTVRSTVATRAGS